MKPYTGDATCPKCATKWSTYHADPKYCDGLGCHSLNDGYEEVRQCSETVAVKSVPPPEHLHLTCQKCGYEWLMECADAEPEEDEPPDFVLTCPHCAQEIPRSVSEAYAMKLQADNSIHHALKCAMRELTEYDPATKKYHCVYCGSSWKEKEYPRHSQTCLYAVLDVSEHLEPAHVAYCKPKEDR